MSLDVAAERPACGKNRLGVARSTLLPALALKSSTNSAAALSGAVAVLRAALRGPKEEPARPSQGDGAEEGRGPAGARIGGRLRAERWCVAPRALLRLSRIDRYGARSQHLRESRAEEESQI
jgi:hypothetical protein